jgi:hypothetical protein
MSGQFRAPPDAFLDWVEKGLITQPFRDVVLTKRLEPAHVMALSEGIAPQAKLELPLGYVSIVTYRKNTTAFTALVTRVQPSCITVNTPSMFQLTSNFDMIPKEVLSGVSFLRVNALFCEDDGLSLMMSQISRQFPNVEELHFSNQTSRTLSTLVWHNQRVFADLKRLGKITLHRILLKISPLVLNEGMKKLVLDLSLDKRRRSFSAIRIQPEIKRVCFARFWENYLRPAQLESITLKASFLTRSMLEYIIEKCILPRLVLTRNLKIIFTGLRYTNVDDEKRAYAQHTTPDGEPRFEFFHEPNTFLIENPASQIKVGVEKDQRVTWQEPYYRSRRGDNPRLYMIGHKNTHPHRPTIAMLKYVAGGLELN